MSRFFTGSAHFLNKKRSKIVFGFPLPLLAFLVIAFAGMIWPIEKEKNPKIDN